MSDTWSIDESKLCKPGIERTLTHLRPGKTTNYVTDSEMADFGGERGLCRSSQNSYHNEQTDASVFNVAPPQEVTK